MFRSATRTLARTCASATASTPTRVPPALPQIRHLATSSPLQTPHHHQHAHTQQGSPPPHPHDDLFPLEVPPLSERLKPLVPFLIWWTIITSLIVHNLRTRKMSEAELDRAYAQESVLRGLKARFEAGEMVPDVEIRRELEMVGLRERTLATAHLAEELGELRNVGWIEMLLGRKRAKAAEEGIAGEEGTEEKVEAEAVEQWSKIVKEATAEPKADVKPDDHLPAQRSGVAKRAASSTVYM